MDDAEDTSMSTPELTEDPESQTPRPHLGEPVAGDEDVEGHGIGLNLVVASAAAAGFAAVGSAHQGMAVIRPGGCIQVASCTVQQSTASAPVGVPHESSSVTTAMVPPRPVTQPLGGPHTEATAKVTGPTISPLPSPGDGEKV